MKSHERKIQFIFMHFSSTLLLLVLTKHTFLRNVVQSFRLAEMNKNKTIRKSMHIGRSTINY